MQFTRTVKAKLLMAFGLILALNIAVGVLAFRSFNQTQAALEQLSDESLADIVAAMTLAHKSSMLASLAPFVSSVRVVNALENESARLSVQVGEFATFVQNLPTSPVFLDDGRRARVERLAGDLSDQLIELVATTKHSLDIRFDLAERRYSFDGRESVIAALEAGDEHGRMLAHRFREAMELVFAALVVESEHPLTTLGQEYVSLAAEIVEASTGRTEAEKKMLGLLDHQASTFDLHRRDLESQQRVRFLLATIHLLSTQLSDEVASIVETTSVAATERSENADRALGRSKEIIAVLGTLALLAAVSAAFYVMRDLAQNLEGVTRAMARLAGGDRTGSVPGLHRQDELGSLARAFDVFKEASFERESLARQVTENSRMVDAMFSNMNDGISVFDETGRLVNWNPQFPSVVGMAPDAIAVGMSFEVVAQRLRDMGGRAFTLSGQPIESEQTLGNRQNTPAQFELHFGADRVIEVRSQPMPTGGFVTTYTDQSERRSVERQLREAQRVEAVGQLTGGIAHDFNNLLAAISGNLQMLHQAHYADETVSARLLRALDATERASAVTQRLLAFARQQTLQPKMTDVNALITNLLDLVEYSLGARIEVRTDLDPALEPILVDPVQLENAILNLVFNSRDAMPEGGTISIRTWSETSGDLRQLCLSLEDDGQGMTPEVLARIYEPFFTTKEKGRGSGLGLSMVHGFIKQSGGEISIDSRPTHGTRVVISLPFIVQTGISLRESKEKGLPARGNGEKVLIVEDDPIMQDTATDMIESLGYAVTLAPDAETAKQQIDSGEFALMFTDMLLPGGMTGLDVAEHAKSVRPTMPILFTSGYAHDGPGKSIELPPDAVMLEKPYAIETLASALSSLIRSRA